MTMLIGGSDLDRRALIIAEIGANHEGSIAEAHRLLDAAAACGVDAVKFQTYRADRIVASTETQRRQHFQRLALTESDFIALAAHARERGVAFLSTPFDLESVDLLSPLVPAFKVASGDLTAEPLLAHIAGQRKPILLSTGMATVEEIRKAVSLIEQHHPERAKAPVVLLHCVSAYPTPDDEANLRAIPFLQQRFDCPVGYSDHTLGIHACLAAVALGATVIEKHFTLDKARTTFRDHQLSADPRDMAALVEGIRRIESMLGHTGKRPSACESENRRSMRRSLAAAVLIPKGTVLSREMLTVLRPGSGLPPSSLNCVVGQRAACEIHPGQLLTAESVEELATCVQ